MENLATFLVRKDVARVMIMSGTSFYHENTMETHDYLLSIPAHIQTNVLVIPSVNNIATIQVLILITVHVIVATTLLLTMFLVLVSAQFISSESRLMLALTHADINECLIPSFNGCPPHAQCNNTVGSFMCICNPGFVSDGDNNCIGIKF